MWFLFCQLLMCLFGGLYYAVWTQSYKQGMTYLYYQNDGNENYFMYNLGVSFGSWMLIFSQFVPISLIVTLDFVKFFQGVRIQKDKHQISSQSQIRTTVQSSNLNEELGQVQYVFSDKTGTLTCNLMEFKNISIGGVSYGDIIDMSMDDVLKKPNVTNVYFRDWSLFKAVQNLNQQVCNCLMMLAVCHTVQVEVKNKKIIYNASSPDELSLLNFAKYLGFEFKGVDDNNFIQVNFNGKMHKFELLYVLEFTSARKRMTVIIRDENNQVKIFCKGQITMNKYKINCADSIIASRLKISDQQEYKLTSKNLEDYGKIGLRTLMLAERSISNEEFQNWEQQYKQALTSLHDRDEKVENVQELIEVNMELLGATAIEDKLQDEVGDTIEVIKQAGVKFWVLTGDKIETAINIGYSCKVLTNQHKLLIIDGSEESLVEAQIRICNQQILEIQQKDKLALIMNGEALIHGVKPKFCQDIMNLAEYCDCFIGCRVSPKQKAEVVKLVRSCKPEVTTLAIGDGANDVNMITSAHVGVGIRGVEGAQAARSSDYAIGEFKILRALMLHQGRECYRRNSILICYNFFKNCVLVFPIFFLAFTNGFSGIRQYDQLMYNAFNVCFTSWPIIIFSIYDEDKSSEFLMKNPLTYDDGISSKLLNQQIFIKWVFFGFYQSWFLLLCGYYGLERHGHIGIQTPWTSEFWLSGMCVFNAIVFVSTFKILMFQSHGSILSYSLQFLSLAFFGVFWHTVAQFSDDIEYSFTLFMKTPQFWFITIIQLSFTSLFDLAFTNYEKFSDDYIKEEKLQAFRYLQETRLKTEPQNIDRSSISDVDEEQDQVESINQQKPSKKKKLQRRHTGFAFSQTEAINESQQYHEI